jgi:hypothetical protein
MSNDSNQVPQPSGARISVFPGAEAASFCSRPTPVVPARDDLKNFDSLKPEPRISYPEVSPSSRPTYVPDEHDYPYFGEEAKTRSGISLLPGDRITVEPKPPASVLPDVPLADPLKPESGPIIALGPIVALDSLAPSTAPAAAARTPARLPWRRWVARGLFVVLFSGVAGLLGYAFKPHVARTARGLGLVAADVEGAK